ncbi:uncharacterized protein CIMG_13688 [Coccidioides immitis RS]|uniref:Uncharacterized protein n=1 Tax=Coccidioides immitis (strain RS) TaxID=246410 RepID=A0A0D8JYX0_COCIM|nr:uncharacterized protein CIMG_13688 [Coccidioides immitis RS]KJF61463.1 hypothetical protein CIMG_13688 [Coccidioides immitis RS]
MRTFPCRVRRGGGALRLVCEQLRLSFLLTFWRCAVALAIRRKARDPANPARSFPLPKRGLASHVADSLSYGTRSKPVAHSPPRPPNRWVGCVVEVSAYTAQSFRGIKFQTVFT